MPIPQTRNRRLRSSEHAGGVAATARGTAALAWLALLTAALPATAAEVAQSADPRTITIADPADALTFARTGAAGAAGVGRVVAVLRYDAGTVTGVDLSLLLGRPVSDPIALVLEQGYERLRTAVGQAPASTHVEVSARALLAPVDLGAAHIAAGTNFPAHADEAGVEDGPFLFPKRVAPTAARASVSVGEALLDYEVELAWVALEPIAVGQIPERMGLILCNDYTDRATLLRNVDVYDVASGKGFTTGKSFPGYLPIGDLFVVPRDYRGFAVDLELRLTVNGELRQQAAVGAAVWDIDQLLAQAWQRRAVRWRHRDEQVGLLGAGDQIPARSLILSGTPSGTVFRGIGLRQRLAGVVGWLAGGWDQPISGRVVDSYTAAARDARIYLQPGDRVVIEVDRMGVIDNEIVR